MLAYLFTDPFFFFISAAALLTAITVHEFAHAWTANRLGDPTAKLAGRVTLNPLAHLDPLGTLMLLILRFGWGKPVPFDPFNLRNPRRDSALISFAGALTNILIAILGSFIIRIFYSGTSFKTLLILLSDPRSSSLPFFLQFLLSLVYFNIILAIFNLIPIHPLDGGKVLIGLLPEKLAYQWDETLNRLGFFIIIFLLMPLFGGYSLVNLIISPIINFILSLLLPGTPLI